MGVVAMVLALALPVVPVVPAYPGARTEGPPSVRLLADGTRVLVSRTATADPVAEVRRKLVVELGAGRVLSDVDDGQRRVLVVGTGPGQPQVVAWREAGSAETHLLVERKLGIGAPAGSEASAVVAAIPRPAGSVIGLPVYPFSVEEPERQAVAGGLARRSEATRFTTTRPFASVAAFYRALVPGAAVFAYAGGTDWLEITSTDAGGASVQLLHEAGSELVQITFFPRSP